MHKVHAAKGQRFDFRMSLDPRRFGRYAQESSVDLPHLVPHMRNESSIVARIVIVNCGVVEGIRGCERFTHQIWTRRKQDARGVRISSCGRGHEQGRMNFGARRIRAGFGRKVVASVDNPTAKDGHAIAALNVIVEIPRNTGPVYRSEEHTSELQSPCNLVCRLLLEKKKKKKNTNTTQKSNLQALSHV